MSVVMIIDDDKGIANLLSLVLKTKGYDVITASNGIAALNLLKTCPLPEIILTDYCMPVLNGCQFIESISKNDRLKNIPVFIITGSIVEYIRFPRTDNFKGIIQKPFEIDTIIHIIQEYVNSSDSYNSSVFPA